MLSPLELPVFFASALIPNSIVDQAEGIMRLSRLGHKQSLSDVDGLVGSLFDLNLLLKKVAAQATEVDFQSLNR